MLLDNILPVPLWSVVVSLIVSIIATIALFLWAIFTEKPWHRIFIVPLNLITASALVGLTLWLTTACTAREVESTEDLEVKAVTFPDGKTIQMFYADGKNHNANEIFGSMVPEDSTVKRTIFKKTYCGIYYTQPRPWLQDTYTISKKEKK